MPFNTVYVAAALGLVIGSFLNVVVARLPHDRSLSWPGSHCPRCKVGLRWHDNIPVLSWLWLRGRCRGCQEPISLRYPVIELLTAILFLAAHSRLGFSPLLVVRDWPFCAILIAVTFIDLEHRLIPDRLSLGGLALGLATAWWTPGLGLINSILGAAFGFGLFYAFAWVYWKRSGKHGLGGGDIKLLAMLGAFLGPTGVFVTVLVSSVLGSIVGVVWALASRRGNVLGQAIPYGPFLVVGGLYYYFLGELLWPRFMTPT